MSDSNLFSQGESETVSFRIDADLRKVLAEQAAIHQQKPNLFARSLVQKALTGGDFAEMFAELDSVRREVRELRDGVATLAFLLLVKVAKEEPAKAEEWVRKTMKPS